MDQLVLLPFPLVQIVGEVFVSLLAPNHMGSRNGGSKIPFQMRNDDKFIYSKQIHVYIYIYKSVDFVVAYFLEKSKRPHRPQPTAIF